MNNTIKFLVKKVDSGERADIFLSKKINDLTRSFLKKLIKKQDINKVPYGLYL